MAMEMHGGPTEVLLLLLLLCIGCVLLSFGCFLLRFGCVLICFVAFRACGADRSRNQCLGTQSCISVLGHLSFGRVSVVS